MTGSTFFGDIVIQSKDDEQDWRGFVHCRDEEENEWELRSYGESPQEAAEQGWERYLDRPNWETWGYPTKRKGEGQTKQSVPRQSFITIRLDQALAYETYRSWWVGYIPAGGFLGNLVAKYLVWKTKRKMNRIPT